MVGIQGRKTCKGEWEGGTSKLGHSDKKRDEYKTRRRIGK